MRAVLAPSGAVDNAPLVVPLAVALRNVISDARDRCLLFELRLTNAIVALVAAPSTTAAST
jgi:hypothetical protein